MVIKLKSRRDFRWHNTEKLICASLLGAEIISSLETQNETNHTSLQEFTLGQEIGITTLSDYSFIAPYLLISYETDLTSVIG
jgi:hypothetical protein